MKSGKTIKVTRIKNWRVKSTGNEVTSLTLDRRKPLFRKKKGLVLASLNLSQIEAIEQV